MDCPTEIQLVHEQVAIFTLENCPKCLTAKQILTENDVKYIEFDLSKCSFALADGKLKNIEVAPTILIKKNGKYLFLI